MNDVKPERTPCWNPPSPQESQAQANTAVFLAGRYSHDAIAMRLSELQSDGIEDEVALAVGRLAARVDKQKEIAKLQAEIERLKQQQAAPATEAKAKKRRAKC